MTTDEPITEFQKEYRFLSNFWPCHIFLPPHHYPSVEHAYQAAKTDDWTIRRQIKEATSAGQAKRIGAMLVRVSNWEQIKLEVMSDLLWQKFMLNPELRVKLVATGTRKLIEGNRWGDRYWGVCNGTGHNHLGNLLMRLREIATYIETHAFSELHDESSSDAESPVDSGHAG